MGGTKRSSESGTDPTPPKPHPVENGVVKKPKKAKKEATTNNGGLEEPPPPVAPSPMEVKKKRKALDKLRHQKVVEEIEEPEKMMEVDEEEVEIEIPQLHIGVFKDLASADEAVREAAAEKLVEELVEIQRVFEQRGDGEEEGGVESGMNLEDGLEGCAPSVRYAVRRLVLGVSSSREVVLSLAD